MPFRDRHLAAGDDALLRECEVDCFRASGPGGQKRNKTSSAVRLRHRPTGLAAQATESRSQHENRTRALRRLREMFALELREPVALQSFVTPEPLSQLLAAGRIGDRRRRAPGYLVGMAALLDLLLALECSVADTAKALGVSTAAVSRLLVSDEPFVRKVNELRAERGLKPLH